ncbi:MAG: hypothetical protein R3E83_17920 [Burkholderiaceae bacterium]
MNAASSKAYVALGGANHVAIIDIASARVEQYVLVGRRPWGLSFNKAQTLLYVTNGRSDDMSVIDVGSAKVVRTAPVGRVPHTAVVYE